jgi:hypothetical protein
MQNEIDATNLHIVRNEGTDPLYCYQYHSWKPTEKYYDETPLEPRHVRVYEFLHGYDDYTFEVYDRPANPIEQALSDILTAEIQKEVNKAIIQGIAKNAKEADPFDVQEWMRKRGQETS